MKIGYAYFGPKTLSLRKQRNLLVKADVAPERIYSDEAPNRIERDEVLNLGTRPGDIVVLSTAAALGSGRDDNKRMVMALAEKNVQVQIADDGEPVLYDSDELAQEFADKALLCSRRQNGMVTGPGATGRPSKWAMNADDEAALRILWHDLNVPMKTILAEVKRRGGQGVIRENLYDRLGPRRRKSGEQD